MRNTLFWIFSLLTLSAFCQESEPVAQPLGNIGAASQPSDDVKVLYRNEMSGGFIIHTGGFGVNFRRGKHVTGFSKRILELEMVNMRHPKEVKIVNDIFDNSKGFFYGKLHSMLILRPGIGLQKVIYTKPEKNGVEIRTVTSFGLSLGLAKPVYLEILHQTQQPFEYELSTEKYDPEKHDIDDIYGRAPYFKGFEEMKIFPGGYARFGLNFEYGAYDDDVKALETGIIVDVYPKVVPLMAHSKNQQVFVSLYLNFLYGRKWF